MIGKPSLTERFRQITELRWSEFLELEADGELSNYDGVVVALVRACTKGNLRSIQTSLDRLDGKVAQEIEVVMPTFYTLYPYATVTEAAPALPEGEKTAPVPSGEVAAAEPDPDEPLPTGSLRAVLERMLHAPKTLVSTILAAALALDAGHPSPNDPLVKSVIVAGLLQMVHNGKVSAIFEVLDQIDGKVKETVRLLGDDIYLTSYDAVAPYGAEKNKDGIYQVENRQTTAVWAERLDAGRKLHR